MRGLLGWVGALWGLGGILFLLGFAIWRLFPLAVEGLRMGPSPVQWALLVGFTAFMLHAEGYRGFQRAFSPRVAARARHLRDHPRLLHAVLAPLFCMAWFHAPRRRRVISIGLTAGVIFLVLLVRGLPQPWRGLVDTGVVLGLAYGFVATLVFGVRALACERFGHSPEVP
jgi:hypothetical protein